MTGIAFLFEVVAGIIAHSSALLSDAGHMQTMMLHPISLSNEGGG
jgi:Co/Zn/Cd efflux system component